MRSLIFILSRGELLLPVFCNPGKKAPSHQRLPSVRILCNRRFKLKVGSFIIGLTFACIKETNPVSGRSGQRLGGGW